MVRAGSRQGRSLLHSSWSWRLSSAGPQCGVRCASIPPAACRFACTSCSGVHGCTSWSCMSTAHRSCSSRAIASHGDDCSERPFASLRLLLMHDPLPVHLPCAEHQMLGCGRRAIGAVPQVTSSSTSSRRRTPRRGDATPTDGAGGITAAIADTDPCRYSSLIDVHPMH